MQDLALHQNKFARTRGLMNLYVCVCLSVCCERVMDQTHVRKGSRKSTKECYWGINKHIKGTNKFLGRKTCERWERCRKLLHKEDQKKRSTISAQSPNRGKQDPIFTPSWASMQCEPSQQTPTKFRPKKFIPWFPTSSNPKILRRIHSMTGSKGTADATATAATLAYVGKALGSLQAGINFTQVTREDGRPLHSWSDILRTSHWWAFLNPT